MNRVCPIEASSVPLYPPRVMPPPKPLNLPQSFIEFLRNPLLIIPEPVYHEPLVVLRGPAAIVWVTDPTLVKIVLADRCNDFPQDPLLRRVLGGLFGKSILTSEGGDWRWQHQTVVPLFRYGEIVRYVPSMVAGQSRRLRHGALHRQAQPRPLTPTCYARHITSFLKHCCQAAVPS